MNALDFVLREATALDEGDLDTWVGLFTEDARYWAPYDWDAVAPDDTTNIIYDDMPRLRLRVSRLIGGDVHAQDPASRTQRNIGLALPQREIDWQPRGGADEVITVPFHLTERRRKVSTQYAGRYTYWLRREGEGFRMAAKRVQLLESDGPFGNLTFLL